MSTAYSVVYSPEALEDLRAIGEYIRDVLLEPVVARRQVSRIRDAIRGLKTMPRRHALLDWEPWHSREIRRVVVDNYLVFYVVEEDMYEVRIVRILHGSMDLERLVH